MARRPSHSPRPECHKSLNRDGGFERRDTAGLGLGRSDTLSLGLAEVRVTRRGPPAVTCWHENYPRFCTKIIPFSVQFSPRFAVHRWEKKVYPKEPILPSFLKSDFGYYCQW